MTERNGDAMTSTPTFYCSACHRLRGIRDWHDHREVLSIELEPCGHVLRRDSRLEWTPLQPVAA